MAIKTKLPIEFSCGHTETVDLARVPAGRRKAHAFGLGKNRVCTSCFRKKSAEDLELQNRQTLLDADQFAQEHDLPDLTGSDKQVNWATRVRYQVLSDVLVSDETPDQHQQITDVLAIPIGSLVAPAAVIGAALGFGAQRLVQDLLSGFFIITEKQYGFGDLVALTVSGIALPAEGTVEDVTLRVTKLRSSEGEMFTIPNGQIVKTVNLSKDWARAVIDIPVPASADLNRVNDVLHEVANKATDDPQLHDLLLDAPQLMGVESIELDTVTLRMVARTLPGKQFEVGRRMRILVIRALRIAGIVAPGEVAPPVVAAIPHPARSDADKSTARTDPEK